MKKINKSLIFLLVFGIILLSSALAQGEKKIESMFEEAMKDIDKMAGSSEPATKEALPATKITVEPGAEKKLTELIDLDFKQADIEDILKVVAETAGINIVLDPAVRGRKMDLHLKKTNITEVLDLIYNAQGFSAYAVGNVLFISSEERIKRGTTKTKVVGLKNIPVEEAKTLINNLVSAANLGKEANALVLTGAAEDVKKAEEILKNLDVPQPQVLLEAKVIEINNDYLKELGVSWSNTDNVITTTTFQETKNNYLLGTATLSTPPLYSPLHIHRFARQALQFDATLKLLEQKNKAKVLSSPRVNTINNKEAEIFIGDKIPYTITTVTGGAASTEVRFVEPGIRLRITPSTIHKDFVVIKISPEVSYIYSWRGADNQYPWIKSREATAYVRVRNGEPFIMGGLLSKEDKNNLYQVPFLGKIPLLGNLFTYEKKVDYNTDLVITVIPTIVAEE